MIKRFLLVSVAVLSLSTAGPVKADPDPIVKTAFAAAAAVVIAAASPMSIVQHGFNGISALAYAALSVAKAALQNKQ